MNIYKTIRDFMKGTRDNFGPSERKLIAQYGSYRVFSITICRSPINSMVDSALNLLSLGRWQEVKDKYSFDKMFHLFVIIDLEMNNNHVLLRIEKNEVIKMNTTFNIPSDTQTESLEYVPNGLTLNELLQNMINKYGKDKIFRYSAWDNNCQNFIMMLLDASNLLTIPAKNFIYQDITKLVEDLPSYTKIIGNATTDLAHRADILLRGSAFKRHQNRHDTRGNVFLNRGRINL